MKKSFLVKIKLIILPMLVGVIILIPATANAEIQSSLCQGTNLSFSSAAPTRNPGESEADYQNRVQGSGCEADGVNEKKLNNLISKIVNIVSVIVGITAVIMIIVGGFKYVTSGGDSNKVGSAKNTIIYAIVGLVIVALAQIIVRFVLSESTNLANKP